MGGGSIGTRHLKNLKILGHSGIVVLKREYDQEYSKVHDVKVITSYDEAAELDLDAIFICTPTSLHNKGLKFGVQKDLAIFMEKPLIHSYRGLLEARNIMKGYKNVFFIGFMLRYHPLVKKIGEIIKEGRLGNVFSARFSFGSFLPFWHPWEDYTTSYAARKDLGGGVINTISHEVDLMQYYFGNPEAVYCEARNFARLGIDVEEICDAVFSYGDKVVSVHLDYLQKDYQRTVEILCENGLITWNWHDGYLNVKEHGADLRKCYGNCETNSLYISELKEFWYHVSQDIRKHFLDFNHAIDNMNILFAMHRSAEAGARIVIKRNN